MAAKSLMLTSAVSSSYTVADGLLKLRTQKINPHYTSSSLLFFSPLPSSSASISSFARRNPKPKLPPKTVPIYVYRIPSQEDGNGGRQMKLGQFLVSTLTALLISVISMPLPSLAAETVGEAALFGRACIGCHDAGGNIIQPGATLFAKDLEKNGVDTEEEIYDITYNGKGRMPGFGQKCTPRGQCTFGPRLQDEEIRLLAQFVKSQADQAWPPIP